MSQGGEMLVIGVDYTSAPVEIREKLDSQILLQQLASFPHLFEESVILATCNRIEIYVVSPSPREGEKILKRFFPLKGYYFYKNQDAVKHLYTVAAGLDSMVLGEPEILSQVKIAYKNAKENQTIGSILHQLFKEAIRVGKYIRQTTPISTGITSLAPAALLLAKKQLKTLSGKKILLIGAGDMSRTLLKLLQGMDMGEVVIANRTYGKAVQLTQLFGGKVIPFEKIPSLFKESDIVISATASTYSIIPYAMVREVMKKRNKKPLCLIDLAVPRDIDAKVATLKGVHLFDIDDLEKIVHVGMGVRKKATHAVESIIENEVDKFLFWHKTQQAVPVLTALTKKSAMIRDKELERALNKLPMANDHDKKIVATLAKRLESKLIARLIANLRSVSEKDNSEAYLTMIKMLFEL